MNFIKARKAKIAAMKSARDAEPLSHLAKAVMDANFVESEHPRADNGQFGQGGGGTSEKQPITEVSPEKKEEIANAWNEGIVPDGWFVHGRGTSTTSLDTGHVTQVTRDTSVAEQYAGSKGSVWYLKKPDPKKTLDCTSQDSPGVEKIKIAMKEDFESGSLPSEIEEFIANVKAESDEYGEAISNDEAIDKFVDSNFVPDDLVDSAAAYDNEAVISWLWEKFEAEFIETPGETGVFLDLADVPSVNVTSLLSER